MLNAPGIGDWGNPHGFHALEPDYWLSRPEGSKAELGISPSAEGGKTFPVSSDTGWEGPQTAVSATGSKDILTASVSQHPMPFHLEPWQQHQSVKLSFPHCSWSSKHARSLNSQNIGPVCTHTHTSPSKCWWLLRHSGSELLYLTTLNSFLI